MRNFKKLIDHLNVEPLLERIDAMPELWREINIRQLYPGSSHHSTETIFIRGPLSFDPHQFFYGLWSMDYPALYKLRDVVLPVVSPVMHAINATEIGRVMAVKLLPQSIVNWHIDEGGYADHFSRFHIALKTSPECTLKAGIESAHFKAGEAWWFNHKVGHCAVNPTDEPRIHLIFDAVTPLFTPGETNEVERTGETV